MISESCSVDEVHFLLEAGAVVSLVPNLLQKHPSVNHLVE